MSVDDLKVHLRTIAIGPYTYRVVSLRPSSGVRYSTNYFHDTWHVLTGMPGAFVLARLLWGLSYQRQPGTVVLIEAPHLVTTPFDADPAAPILIVPDGLASPDPDRLRLLRRRVRTAPLTTIRWHTFGLPLARDRDDARALDRYAEHATLRSRERMSRRAGFICYTAPALALRALALSLDGVRGATYIPVGEHLRRGCGGSEGEVQILDHFERQVACARVARRELLGDTDRPLASDDERWALWDHVHRVDLRKAQRSRQR